VTGAQGDRDLYLASDPRTPPAWLAEIAARRPDLHAIIAANPAAYPALRQWMASRGAPRPMPSYSAPAASMSHGLPHAPAPPRRRRSAAGWLVGGGCLTAVVLVVAILGGGALLVADDGATGGGPSATTDGGAPATSAEGSRDPAVAEQLALFETERAQFYDLYAQIEHHPVAPLVADLGGFVRLEQYATQELANVSSVQESIVEAQERRQELQDRITAAEGRRTNSSGSRSEELIDSAGEGFIDVVWDAASVCSEDERQGWRTTGCVKKGESLVVHLLPESEYSSVWVLEMIVQHELAHVYQRADTAGTEDLYGEYRLLLDQGMFQGSDESMADCFALTYYDEWTLETEDMYIGYGYVCNESERAAIREWAADLGVVMPG
jgi:hypothetical protein